MRHDNDISQKKILFKLFIKLIAFIGSKFVYNCIVFKYVYNIRALSSVLNS